MPKKKKVSQLELKYRKERKRVQSRLRAMEKRGYVFVTSTGEVKEILPPIPKKITKASVARLQKLTTEALYRQAQYITPEGRIVSGRRGLELERETAGRKAAETMRQKKAQQQQKQKKTIGGGVEVDRKDFTETMYDRIIAKFREDYSEINIEAQRAMDRILNDLIRQWGKDDVAIRLERAARDGHKPDYKVWYESDAFKAYWDELMTYFSDIMSENELELFEDFLSEVAYTDIGYGAVGKKRTRTKRYYK